MYFIYFKYDRCHFSVSDEFCIYFKLYLYMTSFWSSKPVKIGETVKQIMTSSDVLKKIKNELENSKIKLKFDVKYGDDLSEPEILHFCNNVNKHYHNSNTEEFSIIYSPDLIKYFLKDSIILRFYSRDICIGCISGKRKTLIFPLNKIDCIEVNFLCLFEKLRGMHVSSEMINILTKECIERYNTSIAYYTISKKISSPSFCEKQIFHRPVNIDNLLKINFIYGDHDVLKNRYLTNNISTKHIKYINGSGCDAIFDTIYTKLLKYSKNTYTVFDHITRDHIRDIFENKSFHHFLFYNDDFITDYICMFKLNTVSNLGICRNGVLFALFLDTDSEAHLKNIFDNVSEYSLNNDLLDVITMTDLFDVNYKNIKFLKGTESLNYHIYNLETPRTKPCKNGLVTI